jgi:hypothetical protein
LALRVNATANAAGFNIGCRHCTRTDSRELARLARFFGANMMVVPVRGSVLSDRVVEGIVRDFFGPVLLVAKRS